MESVFNLSFMHTILRFPLFVFMIRFVVILKLDFDSERWYYFHFSTIIWLQPQSSYYNTIGILFGRNVSSKVRVESTLLFAAR